jgi:hypothetical protein
MFKRKTKNQLESPLRDRRARTSPQSVNPAFSYYTSRPESGNVRPEQRGTAQEQVKSRPKLFGQLPLFLLLLVALICISKLLLLGTDPKIIMLGKTAVSTSYTKPITTYEVAAQKLLAGSITSHTKITVNLDGTAQALRRQFPELQAVSVTLPLIGNRPIVYAQVAQPSVIVQSAHGDYALNKSGMVLSRISTLPSGVPLLVDQSGVTPRPGHQYLPGTTISFIQTVEYQLAAAKLPVAAFVLPAGSPYELDVRLEGKPYVVRCNLVADALVQSGAAVAAMQRPGAVTPGTYLDVRTPDRVYYK